MMIPVTSVTSAAAGAPLPATWPGGFWGHWAFFTVVLIALVLTLVMGAIYIERRGMGRMQSRLGPMEAGPYGSMQLLAEVGKWIQKEDIIPWRADRKMFAMAPYVVVASGVLILAGVPFGPPPPAALLVRAGEALRIPDPERRRHRGLRARDHRLAGNRRSHRPRRRGVLRPARASPRGRRPAGRAGAGTGRGGGLPL